MAALAAELAPYAWRDLTESMLGRRVIAAADRFSVLRLIDSVPGAAVGVLEPLEPAAVGDLRVHVLVRSLHGRRWRGLISVERVCVDLLAVLDAWQAEGESFDFGVRRMLDGR